MIYYLIFLFSVFLFLLYIYCNTLCKKPVAKYNKIKYTEERKENFTPSKNWINSFFDVVYIITIPKRLKNAEAFSKNLNIEPIIIDAVLKDSLERRKLLDEQKITYDNSLYYGRIACHLSHMKTLAYFLKSDYKTCLIFEDDIIIEKDAEYYHAKIDSIMKSMPTDWDIINFGPCWDVCRNMVKINDDISKSYEPHCRHAYSVTRKGAEIILQYAIPMKNMNGDKIIGELIKNNKLICYSTTPPLFVQNRVKFKSELGNIDTLKFCIDK